MRTAPCSSSTRPTAWAWSGDAGRGAAQAAGIAGEPDVVVTVTLSKSLGSQGGAVLGDPVVVEHLVNTARSFIFDTGLAPAAAAGALAALAVLRAEPELAGRVRARARELAAGLDAAGLPVTDPQGAVVSVLVGRSGSRGRRRRHCCAPTACGSAASGRRRCPTAISRLRLTARADLTDAEVDRAVSAVRSALGQPAAVHR